MFDSIKEYNPEVYKQVEKLDSFQKKVFAVSSVGRCKQLVASFDETYDENRSEIFNDVVKTLLEDLLPAEKNIGSIDKIIASLKKNVPDTEEFGDTEGTVAQNAFLAAVYACSFLKDGKKESFNYCLDKVLENIDTIHYDRNEDYDEEGVFTEESHILEQQVEIIRTAGKDELHEKIIEFIEGNQITLS
jgi:uncharacterized protein YjaG (DUF416 family)